MWGDNGSRFFLRKQSLHYSRHLSRLAPLPTEAGKKTILVWDLRIFCLARFHQVSRSKALAVAKPLSFLGWNLPKAAEPGFFWNSSHFSQKSPCFPPPGCPHDPQSQGQNISVEDRIGTIGFWTRSFKFVKLRQRKTRSRGVSNLLSMCISFSVGELK